MPQRRLKNRKTIMITDTHFCVNRIAFFPFFNFYFQCTKMGLSTILSTYFETRFRFLKSEKDGDRTHLFFLFWTLLLFLIIWFNLSWCKKKNLIFRYFSKGSYNWLKECNFMRTCQFAILTLFGYSKKEFKTRSNLS